MKLPRIVIDTNVLIAALQSRSGASYRLLGAADRGLFEIAVSVSLALEYESAGKRFIRGKALTVQDVDAIVDYLCSLAVPNRIYYLWRPFLKDAKDDMVLELAVAAGCSHIVTFNTKDFAGVDQFGISNLRPVEFLRQIGEIK